MSISNLSQKRARFAFNTVNAIKAEDWSGEFKSFVKKTPMMIRNNGLAATYAFIWSKAEQDKPVDKKSNRAKAWIKIGVISKKWLIDENYVFQPTLGATIFEDLIKQEPQDYRRCTREIFTLFTWLKRYADALIEKEVDNES